MSQDMQARAGRRGVLAGGLLIILAALASGCLGEGARLTYAPADGQTGAVDLAPQALADYLGRSGLATNEIVQAAGEALRQGVGYRQRVKDQMDRGTLATVYVDRDMALHVVTFRTETCPECKGTGTRPMPFEQMARISVDLRCLKCEGKGKIEGYTNERRYILTARDFRDPAAAQGLLAARGLVNVPPEARMWINALASGNPRERLAACVWLDLHYVRIGERFQNLMPMLDKNRYFEKSDEKELMAWQFWAGRDVPGEEGRAYYRIIADARNGKVTRKGFFPDNR